MNKEAFIMALVAGRVFASAEEFNDTSPSATIKLTISYLICSESIYIQDQDLFIPANTKFDFVINNTVPIGYADPLKLQIL